MLEVVDLDVSTADCLPALPGDAQDHDGDDEPDDRIRYLESEGNECRRSYDPEADEAVYACMPAVGDKSGAAQPSPGTKAYLCSDLVSAEPDDAGKCEQPELRQRPWVDEPLDGLTERDKSADEDCEHDSQPTQTFAACAPQVKGDSKRNRRQSVAEVVDQICQQGNTQCAVVDESLSERSDRENGEAERDGFDAGS
jgi:hypothetical protein